MTENDSIYFSPQVNKIESKFSAHYDAVEVDLKSSTVGLLTVEEMVSRQQSAVQEREKLLARYSFSHFNNLRNYENRFENSETYKKRHILAISQYFFTSSVSPQLFDHIAHGS